MRKIIIAMLLCATAMAQQATPVTPTAPVRSALEQKAFEEGKQARENELQKVEADQKKAVADNEAKQRASIVAYSVIDKAIQAEMLKQNAPLIKEASNLMRERSKLVGRVNAIDKRLEELKSHIAEIQKVKSTE